MADIKQDEQIKRGRKAAASISDTNTPTTAEHVVENDSATLAGKQSMYYTQELVDAMIAKAIEEYAKTHIQTPQVIQVAPTENVTLMYMGAVANACEIHLPGMGDIHGSCGTLDVPKRVFFQNAGNRITNKMLERRKLIVIDGLTQEERKRYGVSYKEDELLSDTMYMRLLDMSTEDLCNLFPKLCPEHQKIVVTLFVTAFQNGDNRISLDQVRALNEVSKSVDPQGLFKPILEGYAQQLVE